MYIHIVYDNNYSSDLYSQKIITCQLISLQNLSICLSICKFCVDKNQSFPRVDVELIRTLLLLFMSFHFFFFFFW